ncbi:SPRY domain-containing protein 7 [Halyomorpha halys]|uniref:SPRY domain-containing protein 7 n=1 Tax=Halyomorpha halys TaxID=286706 RepID=UPI0006D4FB1D|nr:SPRY domain-containing protein 7 [Halyomorpha halys]
MSLASICCFKTCFEGTGFTIKGTSTREITPIVLDNRHMGHDVVILKNGFRICGNGGALCTAPLVQSKSYFEVKIQQGGKWSIGLATRKADFNSSGGKDSESWVLTSNGTLQHNGTVVHSNLDIPTEGNILGVSYDHIELNFYVNGKALEKPLTAIKGTVYPALFVDDGAVLDLIIDNFQGTMPSGFERILIEQSLL